MNWFKQVFEDIEHGLGSGRTILDLLAGFGVFLLAILVIMCAIPVLLPSLIGAWWLGRSERLALKREDAGIRENDNIARLPKHP